MSKYKATLTDRLFVGLISGIMALVIAGFIWFVIAAHIIFANMLPSIFVWGIGLVGFVMGFLTLENYLLKILSAIWNFIYKYIGWLIPY